MKTTRPRSGRLLGFDFGLKRIGVASANLETGTSQALTALSARDGNPVWSEIENLVEQWQPVKLVVGLPLNMDGSEGAMARQARRFADQLGVRFALEINMVDERLSTAGAEELLQQATPSGKAIGNRRRRLRDGIAAELILRTYMNDNRS